MGILQSKIGTIKKIVSNNLVSKGIFSKSSSKQFVIIMYHGIDKKQDTTYNQRFFSQDNFEQQVIDLKKYCNILSHNDFVHNNYSSEKPNVIITFDDGYANNFRNALPVLNKYDVHAFFFITGVGTLDHKVLWADALDIVSRQSEEGSRLVIDNIEFTFTEGDFINQASQLALKKFIKDSKTARYKQKEQLVEQLLAIYDFTKVSGMEDYWQLMSDEDIRKSAQCRNVTIGSHGFYHNNLGSLSNDDAMDEVLLSKKYLENITQTEVNTIGFPDGSYTVELNDSLYKAGFKQQYLVDYKFDDRGERDFAFERVGLYPFMGNNKEILYKILHL
jgi:peptidoglycan/xylan/chitin deacetylase (PgdA/CDA1 family)